jgi:hypothetical protein
VTIDAISAQRFHVDIPPARFRGPELVGRGEYFLEENISGESNLGLRGGTDALRALRRSDERRLPEENGE